MLSVLLAAFNGFALVASTPRADYYALPMYHMNVKMCEAFIRKTEVTLGVRLPRFEYYVVGTPSDVFRYSEERYYAGGVAHQSPLYVIAVGPCNTHELVHMMTFQLGRPPDVFEEGVASYLSDEFGWLERFNAQHEARRLKYRYGDVVGVFRRGASNTRNLNPYYALCDAFVRHLVKTYGLERMTWFFRTGTDESFQDLYGMTPAESFDAWLYGSKGPARK